MYIAILKTAGLSKSKLHKGLPADYPIICREVESLEAGRLLYPYAEILSIEEFEAQAAKRSEIHAAVKAWQNRPWHKLLKRCPKF